MDGKLLGLMYCFFALLVSSTYIAELTRLLSVREPAVQYKSISDLLVTRNDKMPTVCAMKSTALGSRICGGGVVFQSQNKLFLSMDLGVQIPCFFHESQTLRIF